MQIIGIYKITNPKGKVYIGKSIELEKRVKSYCWEKPTQPHINNSIKKYGVENHKFELEVECDEEYLDFWEDFFITKYNSIKEGMNIKGGGVGGRHNESTKKKMSIAGKRRYSEEGYKPIWEGKKRPNHSKWLEENGSGLSYTRTAKHKAITSKSSKESWLKDKEERSKKISLNKMGKGLKAVICIETNKRYESIKACSADVGISKGCICNFLKGSYAYPTLKGLTFRYVGESKPPYNPKNRENMLKQQRKYYLLNKKKK